MRKQFDPFFILVWLGLLGTIGAFWGAALGLVLLIGRWLTNG